METTRTIEFSPRAVRPTDAGPMRLRWSNGHSRAVEFAVTERLDMEQALMNAVIDYRRIQPKTPVFVADPGGGTQRKIDVEARYPGQFVVAVGNGDYKVWPTWADFEYWRRFTGNPSDRLELHVEFRGRWGMPIIWGYTHVINSPHLKPDADGVPRIRGTDPVLIIGPGSWHGEALWDACAHTEDAIRQLENMCNMLSMVICREGR